MNEDLLKRYHFFRKHAGEIVGENARYALDLARAEAGAEERGWIYGWPWDDCADWSFVETWPERDQERWNRAEHEVFVCLLRDSTGEVLESLGGIFDPGRDYMRAVQAELADEALYREREAVAVSH